MFNRPKKNVVILGGGFGGLYTAISLKNIASTPFINLNLTLVDKKDNFVFYPFLYETLSEELSEKDISINYSKCEDLRNVNIKKNEVKTINLFDRIVETDGEPIKYDILVIALGSNIRVPDSMKGKPNVFLFKEPIDVDKLRHQILYQIKRFLTLKEKIENENSISQNELDDLMSILTFIIVGAGPSGVELSAKLVDVMKEKCIEVGIDQKYIRIILVDVNEKILSTFHSSTSESARKTLEEKGIEIHLGTTLQKFDDNKATFVGKEKLIIPCGNVIWTGGIEFNPVVPNLGLDTTPEGKILVDEYLQSLHSMGVFAIGDNSCIEKNKARVILPNTAKVAVQQAFACSYNIIAHIMMLPKLPYTYIDIGEMIGLGTTSGSVNIFGTHFEGMQAKWIRNIAYSIIYPGLNNSLKIAKKMFEKARKDKIIPL